MRSFLLPLCGALLILLGLAPAGDARTMVLKESARLREGPSRTTPLVAELPAGTTVEVSGEERGWLQVTAEGGRVGYVWSEHAQEPGAPAPPAGPAADGQPKEPPPSTLQESIATLRAEVAALRERPDPPTTADLEALRAEVHTLAEAQRELLKRADRQLPPPEPHASAAALGWLGLGLGLLVGWFAALLVRGRGDRTQPRRLRL